MQDKLFLFPIALAVTGDPISLGLAERVSNTYTWALGIGGMVALGIIIFGGVLYSASGGNPGRIDEAKKWIQHALFGLALLFSSYLLLNFINPDLTRLQEIFLDPNPQVQGPTLEGLPGGGKLFGKCVKGKLAKYPTPNYGGDTCGGFYTGKSAPVGNFGDFVSNNLKCERPPSKTEFVDRARDEFRRQLVRETSGNPDYCQRNIDRVMRIMTDVVVPGESNYNPNAFAPCSTSGRGAFGLFQMNPVNPINPNSRDDVPYDRGDVPWREQIKAAVIKVVADDGEGYWAQWPEGTEKLIDCSASLTPLEIRAVNDN